VGPAGGSLTVAAGAGEARDFAAYSRATERAFDPVAPSEQEIVLVPACEEESVVIPDLRGMSVRCARRVASAAGLELSCEGSGLVRKQTPRPGGTVEPGHRVVVTCYPG
jgi:hypothetical protein